MIKNYLFLIFLATSIFAKDDVAIDFGTNVYSTITSYSITDIQSYSSSVYSSSWDWDDDDKEDDDDNKYQWGGGGGSGGEYCGPAVPEPSTYALIAGLTGLLFAVYKRKK
jgi:hypothetical protein